MNNFFEALKYKKARKEFLKSNLVGIIAVVLDFFIQALILYLAAPEMYNNISSVFFGQAIDGYIEPTSIYFTSIIISFIVSISVNYILSTFFVYQYGNVGRNKNGLIKFFIFSIIGLTITIFMSMLLRVTFGLSVLVAKIIVSILVFLYNFFTRKFYIFNIALIVDDENTIKL